jgi:hypothetical protein
MTTDDMTSRIALPVGVYIVNGPILLKGIPCVIVGSTVEALDNDIEEPELGCLGDQS